jgi:hypothetical protein
MGNKTKRKCTEFRELRAKHQDNGHSTQTENRTGQRKDKGQRIKDYEIRASDKG